MDSIFNKRNAIDQPFRAMLKLDLLPDLTFFHIENSKRITVNPLPPHLCSLLQKEHHACRMQQQIAETQLFPWVQSDAADASLQA